MEPLHRRQGRPDHVLTGSQRPYSACHPASTAALSPRTGTAATRHDGIQRTVVFAGPDRRGSTGADVVAARRRRDDVRIVPGHGDQRAVTTPLREPGHGSVNASASRGDPYGSKIRQ